MSELIVAAFHQGPIFRQRYDRHVQTWREYVRRQVWVQYHTDPVFAAEYDESLRREML